MEINSEFGSIMVIVPHQDDEILLTAGLLRQAVSHKLQTWVVMATNGDYGCSDHSVGQTRMQETIRGLEVLGIDKASLIIMGYADTGMPPEDSFLTHLYEDEDEHRIWNSFCSDKTYGLESKAEYHMQKYGVHGDYSRQTFKQDLKDIIREKKPDNIFTTSPDDEHGDHSALYRFICEVLDELRDVSDYMPSLYCGIVHSCAGDENWPLRHTTKYNMPEGFRGYGKLMWKDRDILCLKEEMCRVRGERNLKYQALLQYETALEPNAYDFLMSFIKDEEIFWKLR